MDDNRLHLYVNSVILRNEKYDVLACLSPVVAVRILKAERVDLAILDYQMPGMSGAALAAFCKKVHPQVKVILFSGDLSIERRKLASVDLFIPKSEGVRALLKGVRALLQPADRNNV